MSSEAILLANHGAVTFGPNLFDAYYKMEKVEHAAHITFVARMLGGARSLTDAEVTKLRSVSVQSYGKDFSEKIACEPLSGPSQDISESELREYVSQQLKQLGVT